MADPGARLTDRRSLLAFGPPVVGRIPPREGASPRPPQVRGPSAGAQGNRIGPQFKALQDALAAGAGVVGTETNAPDAELVVVFDLAGTVDEFMKACALIDGLEFLADLQEERVVDDDFHTVEDDEVTDGTVPQSLYMAMTNAQAVTELVRLFELWIANPKLTFARGLGPLKQVFPLLRAVRRWGAEDRIRETGLLDQWVEDITVKGQSSSRVEIELWYRSDAAQRMNAQTAVEGLIGAAGGAVVTSAILAEIDFHCILADIPADQIQRVLSQGPESIALLIAESVMFVNPARPMAVALNESTLSGTTAGTDALPSGPPRVALLDGLPYGNHACLASRLVIDDPDEVEAKYSTNQQSHGTAMASLIVHGDLSAPGPPVRRPLYVRPILEPHSWQDVEVVPPDRLLVDLVHRSFHRIFEGDGDDDPASPGVRIVNLSIGDPARTFVRRMSPLAKLIDWFAVKYNCLVVVSAGNHDATPTLDEQTLEEQQRRSRESSRFQHNRTRTRSLLSPAESINAVTVGSLHSDESEVELPDAVVDVFEPGGPAGYSASGFGFRRSVKPDVLLPGGRQVFQRPIPGSARSTLIPARTEANGPGIQVAAPGAPGSKDGTLFTYGTSNSAALATRSLDQILDSLEELESADGEFEFPDAQFHPVLAKTLLVHASRWGEHLPRLKAALDVEPKRVRRDITQLLGYGAVDLSRVGSAERLRAVLVGASSIKKDQQQTFYFPLPGGLAAKTDWRRLTITLGWFSPVNMRSQKHRMARLTVVAPRTAIGVKPIEADHNAITRGTVQHIVLEGRDAVGFVAGDCLSISVDCRVDAGKLDGPVRFALAASLEVGVGTNIDVHEQVRQGLRLQVRDRARVQVTG